MSPFLFQDLFYSASWQVLEERTGSNINTQYVWSPVYVDALIERDRDADGNQGNGLEERVYAQQDANFNVTAIISTAGAVLERYIEDGYGKASVLAPDWSARGSSSYSWLIFHQGGLYDAVVGLYYFRDRWYSAELGRWVHADPLGLGPDPNLYRYVGNQPLNALDPLGTKRFRDSVTGHWVVYQKPWKGTDKKGNPLWGSEISIYFYPNPQRVCCEVIAFLQVEKITDFWGGTRTDWAVPELKEYMTADGWAVDAPGGYPWYAYIGSDEHAETTHPGSSPDPYDVAWLFDRPFSANRGLRWYFQTYSVCKRGRDQGMIYGGIAWGFDVDHKGNITLHERIPFESESTIYEAARAWDKQAPEGKTIGDLYPYWRNPPVPKK